MAQLRGMIHGLVDETRRMLYRDVLLLPIDPYGEVDTRLLPSAPLHEWVDNPASYEKDGNWLTDRRNTFEVDGRTWLYERVLREPWLRNKFIHADQLSTDPTQSIPWRMSAITQHFQRVKKVKELLYACVHMTNGGPWRGTEGLTAPFRNSATSDGRGVFISQGMVEFVVGYHKGYGKSAAAKIIHRFVPEEVGEPHVYLVWLGLPFVEIMQSVRDGQRQFSPYMWEPHPSQYEDNKFDELEAFWVSNLPETFSPRVAPSVSGANCEPLRHPT